LDDRFSRGSFEAVVDDWLMPALEEIGQAWADGRITVAAEHLVSSAVHRRLATAYEAAARNSHGPSIIVGLPPGAHHELGILAFATAARRAGLTVTYLGADLPAQDWVTATTCNDARYAVTSLPHTQDLIGLESVVSAIQRDTPRTRIAVGGRHQGLAPAAVHRLGHQIGPAAEWLAHDLTTS
jgi:methanogenic corrinoid protein MtbC1